MAGQNRGGGTGREYPMSEERKVLAEYSNGVKRGSKRIARAMQIMSIFGTGDWRSDFFSEFFAVFSA